MDNDDDDDDDDDDNNNNNNNNTVQHMQGNRGTNGQKTLVRTCTKISRNKPSR